jgi:hypothetical protein
MMLGETVDNEFSTVKDIAEVALMGLSSTLAR